MTKKYGLPYKGSKSKIAEWVMSYLPSADVFVDLFFGGGAMTHCAMLSGKYKRFVCNDIQGDMPRLFSDAVQGKFHNETRWISRDDFFKLKDDDAYVRVCWSFGNNARDYLYGRKIEPYKKACHYAVVLDDWGLFKELCPEVFNAAYESLCGVTDRKERRMRFGVSIVRRLKEIGDVSLIDNNPLYSSCHTKKDTKTRPKGTIRDLQSLERLQSLQSLESLERLESLESLQRLERLERLESLESLQNSVVTTLSLDYQDVEIPRNSVVYADPPYFKTSAYDKKNGFDHEHYYDWLRKTDFPVYASEYQMPDDFVCIGSKKKSVSLSATATSNYTEKLFVHERWADKIWKPTLF